MHNRFLLTAIILLIYVSLADSQEIGARFIFNNSDNTRLQSGYGAEIGYKQVFIKRLQMEMGVSTVRFWNTFQEGIYCAGLDGISNINSICYKYSGRFNIHYLLRNNEACSFSIGPEVGYNYVKGTQKVNGFRFSDSSSYFYIEDYEPLKAWSWGVSAAIEVKNFPLKRTSTLFNVKTTFFKENLVRGYVVPLCLPPHLFEFGIGLNYRLGKKTAEQNM